MVTQQNAVFCAACGYLSVLSFGYMVGFTSPALPQMTSVHEILHNNVDAASWFGSVAMLGAMLGCLLTAWFVDRYGRRTTLLAICVPFFAGCLFIAVGSEVLALCFGRFLIGFASGASSVAAPSIFPSYGLGQFRHCLGAKKIEGRNKKRGEKI
jgi:MFS family permease